MIPITPDERQRRINGAIIAVVALPIALISFGFGHIVDGLDNPDTQCSHVQGGPPTPIALSEGNPADGEWSSFPLGIACVFDVEGDGVPPQRVVHANWGATIFFVASTLTVLGGTFVAVSPSQWVRRRPPL